MCTMHFVLEKNIFFCVTRKMAQAIARLLGISQEIMTHQGRQYNGTFGNLAAWRGGPAMRIHVQHYCALQHSKLLRKPLRARGLPWLLHEGGICVQASTQIFAVDAWGLVPAACGGAIARALR